MKPVLSSLETRIIFSGLSFLISPWCICRLKTCFCPLNWTIRKLMPFSSGYFSVIILLMIFISSNISVLSLWDFIIWKTNAEWILIWTEPPNFPLLSLLFFRDISSTWSFSTWSQRVFFPLWYTKVLYILKISQSHFVIWVYVAVTLPLKMWEIIFWLGFFSLHCLCFLALFLSTQCLLH